MSDWNFDPLEISVIALVGALYWRRARTLARTGRAVPRLRLVALRQRQETLPPSIVERVGRIVSDQRMSTSAPTQTQKNQYAAAAAEFERVLAQLRTLIEGDVAKLEKAMEAAGAPWTPGRIPEWKDN